MAWRCPPARWCRWHWPPRIGIGRPAAAQRSRHRHVPSKLLRPLKAPRPAQNPAPLSDTGSQPPDDLESFSPQRHLAGDTGLTLLPFGGGERVCLGKALAELEIRVMAVGLLGRLQLQLVPKDQDLSLQLIPSPRHVGGCGWCALAGGSVLISLVVQRFLSRHQRFPGANPSGSLPHLSWGRDWIPLAVAPLDSDLDLAVIVRQPQLTPAEKIACWRRFLGALATTRNQDGCHGSQQIVHACSSVDLRLADFQRPGALRLGLQLQNPLHVAVPSPSAPCPLSARKVRNRSRLRAEGSSWTRAESSAA